MDSIGVSVSKLPRTFVSVMCRKTRGAFLLFTMIRFAAVAWEARFQYLCAEHLKKGELWFEPDTCTGKIVAKTDSFFELQLRASDSRLKNLYKEVKGLAVYISAVLLIFSSKARRKVTKLSEFLKIPNHEITLLILLVSTITLLEKLIGIKFTLAKTAYSIRYIDSPFNILAFFLVELPLLMCLAMKLFELLGRKLIVMFYIVLVADNLLDTFWCARVDKARLERVPLKIFPPKLQEMIKSEGMEESIYRVKDSKRTNASQVGFGSFKRIEIQGDFSKDTRKLYPVSFHEIGHSIDNIILKRKILSHLIVASEVLVFIYIYTKGSKAFGFSDMSSEAFVLAMFAMYLILGRPLVLIISNVYAQRSELFADEVARANGYGKELSQTLLDMCLEYNSPVDATFLFNAITSLHPTTRERIDRCG
ncbi:hypothetical protein KMI_05g09430 [Encephalitozoon hellem]|nr:hypothetical protein KMI_05g09430 [Encephalitozoon hellem]